MKAPALTLACPLCRETIEWRALERHRGRRHSSMTFAEIDQAVGHLVKQATREQQRLGNKKVDPTSMKTNTGRIRSMVKPESVTGMVRGGLPSLGKKR